MHNHATLEAPSSTFVITDFHKAEDALGTSFVDFINRIARVNVQACTDGVKRRGAVQARAV